MRLTAICATAVALLAAAPASTESLVTPQAFEAMTAGRTLYFSLEGEPFGAEQYFANHRSLWSFADGGACEEGTWHVEGDLICFVYSDDPGPECWHFYQDGAGFRAALVQNGAETGFSLMLDHMDTTPLPCPGPDIGA